MCVCVCVCVCVCNGRIGRVVTDPPGDAAAARGVWGSMGAQRLKANQGLCGVCEVVCVIKSRVHEDFH